jgi:hypothetical protein
MRIVHFILMKIFLEGHTYNRRAPPMINRPIAMLLARCTDNHWKRVAPANHLFTKKTI